MELESTGLAILVLAALAAGIIDAIAGGGGLVTLPALLAVGIDPHLALGTNKGQAVFGAASAAASFWRAGRIDRGRAGPAFLFGIVGSLLGATLVLQVDPSTLRPVVMALLAAAAIGVTARPTPSAEADSRPPIDLRTLQTRAILIALAVGAWDGFFGPGTGTLLIVGFSLFLRDALVSASANAKVVNLASNLAALALFAWAGNVLWHVAIPMGVAQLLGGVLGARLTVRVGPRLVKVATLAVVAALLIRIGSDLAAG